MVDDAVEDLSPFSDDDSDDPTDDLYGKADGSTPHYRDGCDAPAVHAGKYALGGDIWNGTSFVYNGWVVVDGEKIAEIRTSTQGAPTGVPAIDTKGVIYPGLIDGHGHVEYNHIALADLGKRYGDRDQWPGAALYQTLVKDPKNAVTAAGAKCEALKYGETRALVGGTVMIQGTPAMSCSSSLVRNIEQVNFCRARTRQNVMDISGFSRSISGKASWADSTKQQIAAKQLDAFIVHGGEGIDAHAEAEWKQLKDQGLALPQLVSIHSTGFNTQDLQEMGQVGAKIIWSPSSNLMLYGKTLDVPTAKKAGVNISLGSDWAPSGSANLLGELKIADHVNKITFGGVLTDTDLINMVTINPAKAFALDKFIGSIEVGKYADLLVVAHKTGQSAMRDLINAKPQDVLFVSISGDPLFGDKTYFDTFGKTGDYESIDVCGTPRAIDVTVDSTLVSGGAEKLADIKSKVTAANPKAIALVDCGDSVAQLAYHDTPLAQ